MSQFERRNGDHYQITTEELELFRRDGYVHLRGLVSEEELLELEAIYARFLAQEIPVEGKDYCDMAGDYTRAAEDFALVNIMLPRKYHLALRDNIYERRAASVAEQLCGSGMALDYDQLVAKTPLRSDAVFEWHQDLSYWPVTRDTRTASFWLALDDSTIENGCLHFLPGSHLESSLRTHRPVLGDRGESHTLRADVDPDRDEVRPVPIARGDVTVHHERIVHGSPGNTSKDWRRAYVVAFRSQETVDHERSLGFTHSHNDAADVLDRVGREEE
ncbi:MAG: phytanoyl-CoA hydroxylase [Planctomycetota bacterium]|jgi:phytanoyl-CoA hydroxylase